MKSIILRSPAKLNLFLQVVNKRSDGYHNLVSLFERIDLCDVMTFSLNHKRKIQIFCDHLQVPKGSKNLCFKVAQTLKKDFSIKTGVDIQIKKHIPVAAGLGGGSSNAATTLQGLNKLWQLGLNRDQLVSYAKKIGSDVPFFLYDSHWAIGTERGDKIIKLPLKAKLWHVLLVPRIKVYTKEIFTALNLKLTKKKADVNMLHRALRKNDLPQVGNLLLNDLETTIVQFHPNLLKLKEKLKAFGFAGVLFSGSGPAIYGLVESKEKAEMFARKLRKRYSRVFVVQTC